MIGADYSFFGMVRVQDDRAQSRINPKRVELETAKEALGEGLPCPSPWTTRDNSEEG